MITNTEQIERAFASGKLGFRVSKEDEVRYTLGSNLEQVQAKFSTWEVESISKKEFINRREIK